MGTRMDLIIRNASIYDGSGAEPFTADLGIRAGKIESIGDLAEVQTAETIDAEGLAAAPGFIDMHSHSDWALPQPHHDEVRAPLLKQGITTLVGGNCGASPAPIVPGNEGRVKAIGRILHDEALD